MPRLARLATAVTAAALSTAFLAPASLSAPAPHSATAQRAAIAANPDVAQKVRNGKVQDAGARIGQVMKAMKGQADAGKVREIVLEKLGMEG